MKGRLRETMEPASLLVVHTCAPVSVIFGEYVKERRQEATTILLYKV